MKLQILSDLHLGVAGMEPEHTDADVVVLAGDITRPAGACEWAQRLEKPVIYVAGNHEFYGGELHGTLADLRTRCAGSNVHFLERDALTIDGVRFLGTTLWSDFLLYGEGSLRGRAIAEALRLVADFKRISLGARLFTPDDCARLYEEASRWLDRTLDQPFAGPTVVVTHFAPSPKSIHARFEGSLLNPCFVSQAERLMGSERVKLWIHGHTHDSFDYTVRGTRVVCNPRGYAKNGAVENPLFDARLVSKV
ncbi:MAG TPA: metallophosphoesterase [Burkholderiaceae bacterium]|nr:metallophosphoesterase [Burkholderiaceae bacterium]